MSYLLESIRILNDNENQALTIKIQGNLTVYHLFLQKFPFISIHDSNQIFMNIFIYSILEL